MQGRSVAEMTLTDAIHAFDGKSIAVLRQAVDEFTPEDAGTLLSHVRSTKPQHAAASTWILKALAEDGRAPDLAPYLRTLPDQTDWEAILHILQIAQYSPEAAATQAETITELSNHPRALVRAWALDAFCQAALADPGLMPQARDMVHEALGAEKASIRARARQLASLVGL